MSRNFISDETAAELLEFLDQESTFLNRIQHCAAKMAKHPVGTAFDNPLIKELTGLQHDMGQQHMRRADFQAKLSTELLKTPAAIRLSSLQATPEYQQQIQNARRAVLKKSLTVDTELRTVMAQLLESNVIVTAVLDSILGTPVDRSRYDSHGRPVQQISRVQGRRVA